METIRTRRFARAEPAGRERIRPAARWTGGQYSARAGGVQLPPPPDVFVSD